MAWLRGTLKQFKIIKIYKLNNKLLFSNKKINVA